MSKPIEPVTNEELDAILELAESTSVYRRMAMEIVEARTLIGGVTSCSTCGVCSGACRHYLDRHQVQQ